MNPLGLKGYGSRESIQKAGPVNDSFNPYAPARKVNNKDTIESIKNKVEGDALERLKNSDLKGLTIVITGGKLIFNIFALPPYLVFFVIPKLVFVKAKLIKKVAKKPAQNIKKIVNPIANKISKLATAIKAKGVEYIQWVNRLAKTLFVHLKHPIVQATYMAIKPFLPFVQKGQAVASKTLQVLQEKTAKPVEVAANFAKFSLNLFKNEAMKLVIPYIKLVAKLGESFKIKLNKIISLPTQKIERFKAVISKNLRKVKEVLKSASSKTAKAFTYLENTANNLTKPVIVFSIATFQRLREMQMKVSFNKVKGFIKNSTSDFVKNLKAAPKIVTTTILKVFEAINLAGLKKFFSKEGGFQKKPRQMLKQAKSKIKAVKITVEVYVKNLSSKALSLSKKGLLQIRNLFKSLMQSIQALPMKIVALTKRSYHFVQKSLISAKEFSKLSLFWFKIFLRYSWQELKAFSFVKDINE